MANQKIRTLGQVGRRGNWATLKPSVDRLQIIRTLNDQARLTFPNRTSSVSPSIAMLPADVVRQIGDAVVAYAGFNDADPNDEHDFGAFAVVGQAVFFEIHAFDLDMIGPSPDPAEPEVTLRVLTVTLAHEY